MHPNTFTSNLLGHALRDEVFVIMSFAEEFEERWQHVIQPAIDDIGFAANRVDYNTSGESVIHDILDGIAHARLILADISSVPMRDSVGTVWPQRNANVMWEVGIAHTMRLPDEVLLVRSDSDFSIFDLTQFRAFQYDPSYRAEGTALLKRLFRDRLSSIDRSRSLIVLNTVRSLDALSIEFLFHSVPADGREFTIGSRIDNGLSIPRLFKLGIIEVSRLEMGQRSTVSLNGRTMYYRLTEFGKCVLHALLNHVGLEQTVIDHLVR